MFFQLLDPFNKIIHIHDVAFVRRIEFAADKYSTDLGYGLSLRDGLVAIHVNNQGNLNPDWLYAWFKFDHPAMVERLNAIDKCIMEIVKKNDTPCDNINDAYKAYEQLFAEKMIEKHGEAMALADNIEEGGEIEPKLTQETHENTKEFMGFKKVT